jgi:hypothetical protein
LCRSQTSQRSLFAREFTRPFLTGQKIGNEFLMPGYDSYIVRHSAIFVPRFELHWCNDWNGLVWTLVCYWGHYLRPVVSCNSSVNFTFVASMGRKSLCRVAPIDPVIFPRLESMESKPVKFAIRSSKLLYGVRQGALWKDGCSRL